MQEPALVGDLVLLRLELAVIRLFSAESERPARSGSASIESLSVGEQPTAIEAGAVKRFNLSLRFAPEGRIPAPASPLRRAAAARPRARRRAPRCRPRRRCGRAARPGPGSTSAQPRVVDHLDPVGQVELAAFQPLGRARASRGPSAPTGRQAGGGRRWSAAARRRAPRAAGRPARAARAACRGSRPRRRRAGTPGRRRHLRLRPRRRRRPRRPRPASARPGPRASAGPRGPPRRRVSSTRLVTVTGTATVPRFPAAPSRRRNRSSVCSTGSSWPCSSTRNSRSPARSKTAPRSAPIAETSRFAWPIDSAQRRRRGGLVGREPVSGHRLDLERSEQQREDEGARRVAVVDDEPEAARADRVGVELGEQILRVALAHARRVGHAGRCRRRARAGARGG